MKKSLAQWALLPAMAAVLAACGGGGGGSQIGNNTAPNSITGVAAVGAPLAGASVTLTDSRGAVKTTTADDQGNFSFPDLSGMVGPYQIMAVLNLGERTVSHYSLVATVNGAQTANITQLTSAVTALLNNAGVLTSMSSEQLAALTPAAIEQAKQTILTTIKPLADKIVPSNFDPVTTPFTANGTGADLLLDHLDLTVRSDAVSLINKMAVPDAAGVAVGAVGVVPKSGAPSAIQNVSMTNTAGFEQLQQAFENCFTVPVAQRMTVSSATSATLHPDCASIAEEEYLHNGQSFALRWARAFKYDKFNSNTPSSSDTWRKTKFMRPEVRLRVSSNPEIIAVNIHFNDTEGNNYTTPELIRRTPNGWKLYGNQRGVNAFAEAQLNYYQDLSKAPSGTDYNNINFSRVDSGFRFFVDPRTAFDANGNPDNSYVIDFTTATGYKPNTVANYSAVKAQAIAAGKSMLKCAVVTGPGRMDGNKWMGVYPHGLVLKVPQSSPTQDYVAIDRRLGSVDKNQLDTQMGLPFASRIALPNICGASELTLSSSPNYTVDIQALTDQVHPFTGQIDPSINGRDVKWNTGPRYARISPDADLARQLDNNPVFHFYLIDSNDKLVQKISTRMLGELPPASMAAEIMNRKMVSQMDAAILQRYLDFAGGADVSTTNVANAQWSTAPNAFGADLVGFYSEVQKAKTGRGLRSSSSQSQYPESNDQGRRTVVPLTEVGFTLWDTDADLASDLDLIPGSNFYWRWSEIARAPATGVCANTPVSNALVTSQSLGVARSTRQLNGVQLSSRYLGTDALQSACLDWYSPSRPADKAYLHREVWMRTYTDKNVRFYSYTANKAFR